MVFSHSAVLVKPYAPSGFHTELPRSIVGSAALCTLLLVIMDVGSRLDPDNKSRKTTPPTSEHSNEIGNTLHAGLWPIRTELLLGFSCFHAIQFIKN